MLFIIADIIREILIVLRRGNAIGVICKKRPYTVRIRPLVCLGTLGSLVRFVGRGGEVFQLFAAVADLLGFLRGVGFEFFGELAVCRGYYARRH